MAARLVAAAGDVAVVLDKEGVVLDVAVGVEGIPRDGFSEWRDQRWVDTVTDESRHKIEEMLSEAAGAEEPRWREVNHPAGGVVVPIRYVAVPAGKDGRVIAIGRDLRAVAALQQRLIQAQQSIERDYARMRQAESRYRMLFQLASEAVLILDSSRKVIDANPAAINLLGSLDGPLLGQPFTRLLEPQSVEPAVAFLAAVEAVGRGESLPVRLLSHDREISISASPFRQDWGVHLLVRLSQTAPPPAPGGDSKRLLIDVLERMPDAFVVTDVDLRILAANTGFLELTQLPSDEVARSFSLDRFLGRPGVDVSVLVGNLRQYGSVRNFGTVVRNQFDATEEVEVSAVAAPESRPPCFGFIIRSIGRRLGQQPRTGRELPRSVEQLTDLVGRASLKEIVRETADIIEQLCIEAALELTNNNRASAAEILGLSRQSLYSKLHRYGLVHPAEDDAD